MSLWCLRAEYAQGRAWPTFDDRMPRKPGFKGTITVPKNMEPSRVSLLITGVAYLPSGMIFADEIFIYNVWMTV